MSNQQDGQKHPAEMSDQELKEAMANRPWRNNQPAKASAGTKSAKDMTDEEFAVALRNKAWRIVRNKPSISNNH